MNMQRIIGIVLVVVGVVLLIMGIREADAFASQVSKFFTNSPTDRAIWLIIGGIVCIVAGGGISAVPSRALRS